MGRQLFESFGSTVDVPNNLSRDCPGPSRRETHQQTFRRTVSFLGSYEISRFILDSVTIYWILTIINYYCTNNCTIINIKYYIYFL